MSDNPYESPKVPAVLQTTVNVDRVKALRSVRIALLILLVPAVYNFVCFNLHLNPRRIQLPLHSVYVTINSLGIVLIAFVIWFFGLAILEFVCGGLHSILARKSLLDDWKSTMYVIVRRAPKFAVAGAVLWVIWVAAFYQLRLDFYVVSVPVGVAAHLLAACLYIPLFYRWYRIEHTAASQMNS